MKEKITSLKKNYKRKLKEEKNWIHLVMTEELKLLRILRECGSILFIEKKWKNWF